VESNALESSLTPVAHSEPATDSGLPTDPDRVTLSPAATDLGLTWSLTGSEDAPAGAVRNVRMAKTIAAMMRIGRMATPPRNCTIPCGSLGLACAGSVTAWRQASVAADANWTRPGRGRQSDRARLANARCFRNRLVRVNSAASCSAAAAHTAWFPSARQDAAQATGPRQTTPATRQPPLVRSTR
jgi:hypothetical protein